MLNLDEVLFIIKKKFNFIALFFFFFGDIAKCSLPNSRSQISFFMVFLKSFIAFHFTSRPLVHVELIFIIVVKIGTRGHVGI